MSSSNQSLTSVILAAGYGRRIQGLTQHPKVLLRLCGETLLQRHLRLQHACGIPRIVIVLGYKQDEVVAEVEACSLKPEVEYVVSDDYRTKGNSYSLLLGLERVAGAALVFDGDLFYDGEILSRFLELGDANSILIGAGSLEDVESTKALVDDALIVRKVVEKRLVTAAEMERYRFLGEVTGILRFDADVTQAFRHCLKAFLARPEMIGLNWEHPLNEFLLHSDVSAFFESSDEWMEIDDEADYRRAVARFERKPVTAD